MVYFGMFIFERVSSITNCYFKTKSISYLFNRDLNRGCLVYTFSLRFLGSRFVINIRQQFRVRIFFRVRKIFRPQFFARFVAFSLIV